MPDFRYTGDINPTGPRGRSSGGLYERPPTRVSVRFDHDLYSGPDSGLDISLSLDSKPELALSKAPWRSRRGGRARIPDFADETQATVDALTMPAYETQEEVNEGDEEAVKKDGEDKDLYPFVTRGKQARHTSMFKKFRIFDFQESSSFQSAS
ncbi:uncharacterized protein E0L32_005016 [Thyridium curvatum]|uniref:Uncharacterized protein n=1 Tax=Thyridium curvatum TaxID=1093900 RepID=A0A507B568_9PEZI|nr:uncharacterized protein E0L32_005016 [Thyridium curvatum]TPX14907.1 hypothetical protein E0L32_005016 [Thyridium curvatum]